MKLGIMQPYIFPYAGYFQLVKAVDKFVIYDDVNFIKQGWINRNNILLNGKGVLFTIPLEDASSFRRINEIGLPVQLYEKWKIKFKMTLSMAYSKAPFFKETFSLVTSILETEERTIANLAGTSIAKICEYLKIYTHILPSSSIYNNSQLSGKERVIDICRREGATEYVNAQGGQELYSKDFFFNHGISLSFIKFQPIPYLQFKSEFVPYLSIIDALMFNSAEKMQNLLNQYELV